MPRLTLEGAVLTDGHRLSVSIDYNERIVNDVFIAAGRERVNLMGDVESAKGFYIEIGAGSGELSVNGNVQGLYISKKDGFWVWFNPSEDLFELTMATSEDTHLRTYMFV